MHWKAHLFRHCRLFLTEALTPRIDYCSYIKDNVLIFMTSIISKNGEKIKPDLVWKQYTFSLMFTICASKLYKTAMDTVRAEIFAVVLFARISRVKPSRKFPLQFMSIYSNDNISKIAKLTTHELPHLAKTAKITVRENNDVYSIHAGLVVFFMLQPLKGLEAFSQ